MVLTNAILYAVLGITATTLIHEVIVPGTFIKSLIDIRLVVALAIAIFLKLI